MASVRDSAVFKGSHDVLAPAVSEMARSPTPKEAARSGTSPDRTLPPDADTTPSGTHCAGDRETNALDERGGTGGGGAGEGKWERECER